MNRKLINFNNDDAQYETLNVHQSKYIKDKNTHKDSFSFPIGPTVAIQHKEHEDGGLWMCRVIGEANGSNHTGRSYINRLMKNGKIDNVEHKSHIQLSNNYRPVPVSKDKNGTEQLEDIFIKTTPVEYDKKLNSYTADSQKHMAYNGR